jgi:hypothetical protein
MWAHAQIVDCFRTNSFACVCGDFEQQMRSKILSLLLIIIYSNYYILIIVFSRNAIHRKIGKLLTLSDPTSDLLRQYDIPVLFRCRKTSDMVFVAFVRPMSEPVQHFSSCSTVFSQQIVQVVLFLFLHVFIF